MTTRTVSRSLISVLVVFVIAFVDSCLGSLGVARAGTTDTADGCQVGFVRWDPGGSTGTVCFSRTDGNFYTYNGDPINHSVPVFPKPVGGTASVLGGVAGPTESAVEATKDAILSGRFFGQLGSLTVRQKEALATLGLGGISMTIGTRDPLDDARTIGNYWSCKLLDSDCAPSKTGTFSPNVDVSAAPDVGWTATAWSMDVASVTHGWTVGTGTGNTFVATPPSAPGGRWTGSGVWQVSATRDSTDGAGNSYVQSYRQCRDDATLAVNNWSDDNINFTSSGLVQGADWTPSTPLCAVGETFLGFIVAADVYISPTDYVSTHDDAAVAAGNAVKYRPLGTSDRPPALSPDPSRTLRTVNTCSDSSVHTADSAPFTESSTFPAFPVPAACPSGTVLAGTRVVELTPGLPDKTIWDYTVPDAIKTWQTTYPQCGNGACNLGLWKIGPSGSDVGDCFASASRCTGWSVDTAKAADYECTYGLPGTHTVISLDECKVYNPTFDPAFQAKGVPYADPRTGTVVDTLATGSTDPAPASGGDGEACWPSGWSFLVEPASWVLQPIKCALDWAFVPDASTITDLKTRTGTAVADSGFGPWVTALGNLFTLNDNTGCAGPTVVFPFHSLATTQSDLTLHPVSACDEPVKTLATMSYAIITVALIIGGARACIRALGAGFGYHE